MLFGKIGRCAAIVFFEHPGKIQPESESEKKLEPLRDQGRRSGRHRRQSEGCGLEKSADRLPDEIQKGRRGSQYAGEDAV